MNKFKLCWWECNGYDDSDWYGVYFDTADGRLHKTELGTTRAHCAIGFSEEFFLPTPEVVELARQALVPLIFDVLRRAEDRDVLIPQPFNVKQGRAFRLLVPHSFYQKADGGFAKDEKGKRVKVTIPAGAVVVARADGAEFFGVQYRNGYNKPNRENTTVSVAWKTPVGVQFVRVPLAKLRQHAEPLSDETLLRRADELSSGLRFESVFGPCAWTTDNWAQSAGLPKKVA